MHPKGGAHMTSGPARTLILAGVFAVSAFIPCAAILRAQEVTDVPVSSASPSSSSASAKDKVVDAIEGIKSGNISAAKEAVAFDRLLSYTLIRISDCWTLCKQEMILAKEAARQEAVQAAKDIFQKGKDAAVEQTREAILDKLPPILGGSAGQTDLTDGSTQTDSTPASSAAAPGSSNDPAKIRESIQNERGTPLTPGNDPAQAREAVQSRLREN